MCRDSIKGVRALVASGSVGATPEAIASFLRQHNSSLDKEQLGEYLGHHDELEVCPAQATLHACGGSCQLHCRVHMYVHLLLLTCVSPVSFFTGLARSYPKGRITCR